MQAPAGGEHRRTALDFLLGFDAGSGAAGGFRFGSSAGAFTCRQYFGGKFFSEAAGADH